MPKYRVTIEFETNGDLPEEVLGRLTTDMMVQTESLNDGTYDDIDSTSYEVTMRSSEGREV